MPTVRRVHHAAVSVADIDRSLGFYQGLLELELVFDSDVDGPSPLDAAAATRASRAAEGAEASERRNS